MVNFELTERIKGAIRHVSKNDTTLSTELKDKYNMYLYRKGVKVITLEDLKELSEHLRRIPDDPNEEEYLKTCKWVHELVVGSRVMTDKGFSPRSKGKPMSSDMMTKLKHNEEQRQYDKMTQNLNRQVEVITIRDDLKAINEQISFGAHMIVTMAVMYFAGYFVIMRSTGDMVTAVIAGLICAIVAMMVETWLFMIRSERAEQKAAKLETLKSPPRAFGTTPMSPAGEAATPLRSRVFTPMSAKTNRQ